MIFDVPAMVSDFSEALELSPGDIIMTGTTAGSGGAQSPPSFLKAGISSEWKSLGLASSRRRSLTRREPDAMDDRKPRISGLHHLKIAVSNLQDSLDWYAKVFGAIRRPQYDHVDRAG